jgi:hypothetical protein
MAKKVSIDNLTAEITQAIQQYTEDVSKAIEAEVNNTARTVLDEVKASSPVKTGEYKKGWARKKSTTGGQIKYTIYNKEKPGIVHLLEFGHAKVNGGRVSAIPHLRPAYDRHVPEMEKRIKKIIKNGGD